jgi:dipeptide/tripeptide permease
MEPIFGQLATLLSVCVVAGDQFKLPEQDRQLQTFFSVFYFSINAGSFISTIVTPAIREVTAVKSRFYIGCCYITVDSSTTALQNGACTYQCLSQQRHYKTPFSQNG